MNWSNIKSIFIIAFLFLNSFLGYQLWEKQAKKIEEVEIYESRLDDLLSLKQIINEAELSVFEPDIAQLVSEDSTHIINEWLQLKDQEIEIDEATLNSILINPYELSNPIQENEIYAFLEEYVLQGMEYRVEEINTNQISLVQMIDGFPIFDARLNIELNEENFITGYTQQYYSFEERTEQKVISSIATIRTLLDKDIFPALSIIKDVSLGFYGQQYELNNQLFTPVWRVTVDDQGEILIIYVNAISGAIRDMYDK